MTKIYTTAVAVSALLCAFLTGYANAGDELNAINAQVEQKAQEIDQKYGVLLSTHERNELKLSLVAKKMVTDNAEQTVEEKADAAITTYEISDPTDQRTLLIEIEASESSFNGGGKQPPCCG
jgi:hypothetical protein